ncbi:MAG TPA: AAA family ATPase, partial [Actinomycetes bacterium]|nr:AAA family ATPase [Actinomycetes bacterium]
GDAVNVAARLEQVAAPGEVLLGQSTYRLVRDAVEAERVTPLRLKGKGAPVVAYRLRQVDPGAPGHARRQDAPIVGREPELRLFAWVYERVVSTASSHLLTVLGPAGVGKTRLVGEAVAELPGATVLRGRCLSYGEGITYWPVAEIVRQAAGIADTDPPAEASGKLRALLDADGDDRREREHVAARVAQLIGLEAAPAPAEEAAWAFRRLLELLAGHGPPARRSRIGDASTPAGALAGPAQASRASSTGALVVVLDDLHWAEPSLLDLVEHVADYGRGAPILLVAMARPEFLEQRPGWAGGKLNATTLLLEPLADAEATRLLDALAGPQVLPEAAAHSISKAAGGNPLFLEELLAALVEEGRLRRQDGRWVTADLDDLGIPPSIQALLTARLDRLEDAERAVLERAAVAGQVFDQTAVVALSPPSVRAQVPARLEALVRRELLRPAPARLTGGQGFQFRHLLLRDATYDSIPKQARAELHELFAVWGERTAGPRLREVEEIVGWHLEQAWRYRVELGIVDERNQRLATAAARHLGAAGRRALGRGDLPAASKLLERAVSLLPAGDPGGLELLIELADVLVATGEFTRAEAVLDQVTAAAADRGDERVAAHAKVARLRMAVSVASDLDADAIQQQTRRAIATFAEFEDQRGLAKAWGLLAALGFLRCRIAEAEAAAGQAVTHSRLARDDPSESWAWGLLAQGAFWGPTPAPEGIRRCQELLTQAHGNRRSELIALQSMAGLQAMDAQAEAARATVGRALHLAADMGENRVAALAREFAAIALALAGDPAAAEQQLRHGIRVLERQGESGMRSNLIADLAHILHQLERPAEALQVALSSRAIAAHDDLFAQVRWRGAAARALALQGQAAEAARLAAEAVEIATPTDVLSMRADAHLDQAAVAAAAGHPGHARRAAEAALALYQAKGNRPGAARAEAFRKRLEDLGSSASPA